MRPRFIPVLLLKQGGLYKGVRFRDHKYVGDPMNTIRIFNEKKADEILLVDIEANRKGRSLSLEMVEKIAEECFMPFGIGGGVRTMEEIRGLLKAGSEKVVMNTAAVEHPALVREAADTFGSQSVVVSIDARRGLFGARRVFIYSGTKRTRLDPVRWAVEAQRLGAGEILLTSIDRDGTRKGYDLPLIERVVREVDIPIIACGGAGVQQDLADPLRVGAAAAAAGTLFVLTGRFRSPLVQYPSPQERDALCALETGTRPKEAVEQED